LPCLAQPCLAWLSLALLCLHSPLSSLRPSFLLGTWKQRRR
jgi:hypothetical protein